MANNEFREELDPQSSVNKVIGIVSGKGGVGKSWIALQLAAYKAFQNEKVLLLTSDSQNNVLNYSGIKIGDTNKKGLEDLLEGKNYELTKLGSFSVFFIHLSRELTI